MTKIIAYARKDKRSNCGILMSRRRPRWVVYPKDIYKYNINDYIALNKETIQLRGETNWFKWLGFKL